MVALAFADTSATVKHAVASAPQIGRIRWRLPGVPQRAVVRYAAER
jgi:hypothetical protein